MPLWRAPTRGAPTRRIGCGSAALRYVLLALLRYGFAHKYSLHNPIQIRGGGSVFEILGKLADVGVKLAFEAPPSPEPITLTQAWKEFLTDAKARNLREPTLYKYANESKWIDENHARQLESPKVQRSPTMPFAQDQMAEILIACEKYGNKARGGMYRGPENARRIRAFVLFLRHSGLRIGDAVTLERRRITADKLLLYTAKTGTPVHLPLGQDVILTHQRIKRTVSSFPSS